MSELLTEFEKACTEANVSPSAALKRGGVHPTLWSKWKGGDVSPTLRNFEAAKRGLNELKSETAANERDEDRSGEAAA